MSSYELLEQMEANPELYADASEEPVFIIDNDLRTISIPAAIKSLGVESDDEVHRLHFQMPKMYGELDLSEFDIRINYVNANRDGDVYFVEDKEADTDTIAFSWLVGRNALAYKGDTQFIVCLKKSDADGVVQQEFNTTVAKLQVLQGLETTEKIVNENPDIIEQILKKIEGLTQISPEDIAQAVNDYMTANPVEIPDTLPNPHKLSINISGTVVEYDGSGAVTVTIPEVGTERIEKASTDTVVELQPNKLYIFPEMETLTYTLAEGEENVANEYHFLFQSGTTPTEVVHPPGVNVGSLTVEANRIYEISVMEQMLTAQSWSVS